MKNEQLHNTGSCIHAKFFQLESVGYCWKLESQNCENYHEGYLSFSRLRFDAMNFKCLPCEKIRSGKCVEIGRNFIIKVTFQESENLLEILVDIFT